MKTLLKSTLSNYSKIILLTIILITNYLTAMSQLQVLSNGEVRLRTANNVDWNNTFRTKVSTLTSKCYVVSDLNETDKFHVRGDGGVYGNYAVWSSDVRNKKNIDGLSGSLDKILKIKGVVYERNQSATNHKELGVIAQELEKIIPDAVYEDENGMKGVNYNGLIAVLIEAMKEQQKQIDVLKSCCETKNTQKSASKEESLDGKAKLFQNTPNPFNQNTEIKYYLPKNVNKAYIYIYDMQGTQIKSIQVAQGEGSITISGNELKAGMYIYNLIADGIEIDSKRMILTK